MIFCNDIININKLLYRGNENTILSGKRRVLYMNMNRIRVKNIYKQRGFFQVVLFVVKTYIIHGTKDNNIFNAFLGKWGFKNES